MKLELKRICRKETYTIGKLYIDGEYFCDTLEDPDRDTNRNGQFDGEEVKKPGITAIPNGTYKVTLNVKSPKYAKRAAYKRCLGYLPRLLNVPDFDGVLIHIGNTAADTEGCILVGKNKEVGKVLESTNTFWILYSILESANNRNEEIAITVH